MPSHCLPMMTFTYIQQFYICSLEKIHSIAVSAFICFFELVCGLFILHILHVIPLCCPISALLRLSLLHMELLKDHSPLCSLIPSPAAANVQHF